MVSREGDGQHVLSFHFCLLYVRLMVEFEVVASVGGLESLSGPLWVVLERSWGLCRRSWAALRAYVAGLGLS